MLKRIFTLAIFIAMSISVYAATTLSDDYVIKKDNLGSVPADVNLIGVDKHVIGNTTTGEVARNKSITAAVSTTTLNPCLLYGIIISSTSGTAYTPGTDYVILRDTHVVNTTSAPSFVVMFSTAQSIAGAAAGCSYTWTPPAPIKFDAGICATNSSTNWTSTILFRYLKR